MFIDFQNIHIHNFLSYKDAVINLKDKGYCFVSGKNNFKEDTALSNGAGKSTFLQAICWCLTGETISGVRTEIKNMYVDENETYVELNIQIDGRQYKIIRYSQPRSDLKIFVDGEDKSGKGIRESEKVLAELLPDLTKDLISNVIILGQGLPDKFSSHSPSGRKELLERLSKSDFMIEDIKLRIGNREDILTQQQRKLQDSQLESKTKINLYTNQIENLKQDIESVKVVDYDLEIASIENEIKVKKERLKEIETSLANEDINKKVIREELDDLNNNKQLDLQEELGVYNEFLESIISILGSKKSLATETEKEIKRLKSIKDVCPTCGQKIPGIIKPDTTEQEKQLISLQEEVRELEIKKETAKSKHLNYIKSIDEQYSEDINNKNKDLNRIEDCIQTLNQNKESLNRDIILFKSNIDKLNFSKNNDSKTLNEKKEKLKNIEENIQKINTELQQVEKQLAEVAERLLSLKKINTFVKRDFRGYLLREVIEYLNQKIKQYSLILFNHDNIDILLEGNNLNIYFNNKLCEALSGGERQKIDILVQLTIRDMLVNYMDFHSSILCLDEITDNLDEVGCTKMFELISNELTDLESIFIISHHEQELRLPIDSELLVTKNENGISTIEEK